MPTYATASSEATLDEEAADEAQPSLTLKTVHDIGMAIVSGKYPPGSTLPVESVICNDFGVSRNVLREAIKTLAGKGLIKTVRRAGTIVLPKEEWNLLDPNVLEWTAATASLRSELLVELTQLRVMIEPEVAALAAEHATTTEILRLFEAYEAMERYRHDAKRAIEADILFHRRLFQASHNRLVGSLLPAFMVLLRANFEFTVEEVGVEGFIRNLGEHRVIADAVHARDPIAARAAMRDLLIKNESDLAEALAGGTEAVRKHPPRARARAK